MPDDLTVTYRSQTPPLLRAQSRPVAYERTPHLREPMDAYGTQRSASSRRSQVGKSEFLNNCIGYIIDEDPGSILFIHPNH